MRFLVVTKARQAPPMEAAVMMVEAMKGWIKQYTGNKKMEQIWSFAGGVGGGGIMNVATAEELDAIMGEFPFALYSDIEVYALADVNKTLDNFSNVFKKMAPK
jgi:muconolactone delta-isomerase